MQQSGAYWDGSEIPSGDEEASICSWDEVVVDIVDALAGALPGACLDAFHGVVPEGAWCVSAVREVEGAGCSSGPGRGVGTSVGIRER